MRPDSLVMERSPSQSAETATATDTRCSYMLQVHVSRSPVGLVVLVKVTVMPAVCGKSIFLDSITLK